MKVWRWHWPWMSNFWTCQPWPFLHPSASMHNGQARTEARTRWLQAHALKGGVDPTGLQIPYAFYLPAYNSHVAWAWRQSTFISFHE